VLTVKIFTMTDRPSALRAVCAPVSAVRVTADAPQLPRVHQVSRQSELAQTHVRAPQSNGINGFTVKGYQRDKKGLVVGARGVPPRGRPV
jgi:hypothetical protein